MYDEVLLQETMAERGLNYFLLAKKAKVDPKTAKSIVLTGKGQPEKIRRVLGALGLSLRRAVKRQPQVIYIRETGQGSGAGK